MTSSTPTPAHPARRSLVKGAVWAVPVVTVATAAPAVAASPGCVTVSSPSVCAEGAGIYIEYTYSVEFTNTCTDPATIEGTLSAATYFFGTPVTESVGFEVPDLAAGATVRVSGTYASFFGLQSAPASISVTFSVDDIEGGSASFSNPNPWPCVTTLGGSSVRGRRLTRPYVPSDDDLRQHLEEHPEILRRPGVQDYLRSHPEADPRTTSREGSTETESSTSIPEPEATPEAPADSAEPTAPPADDAGTEPEETEAPPADADTSEVTSSPNE